MMSTDFSTPPVRAKGVVHHLIADTAKGLAAEFWEQMATGRKDSIYRERVRKMANRFYREWPNQKLFVSRRWDTFLGPARTTLIMLLESPTLAQTAKDDIAEALLLDGTVNPKALSAEAKLAETLKPEEARK